MNMDRHTQPSATSSENLESINAASSEERSMSSLENQSSQQNLELLVLRDERDALREALHQKVHPADENENEAPEKKIQYLSWASWKELPHEDRTKRAVVEVLTEKPGSVASMKLPGLSKRYTPAIPGASISRSELGIERVRINSAWITQIFKSILNEAASPNQNQVFLKPFKLFVYYEKTLQDILDDLQRSGSRKMSLESQLEPQDTGSMKEAPHSLHRHRSDSKSDTSKDSRTDIQSVRECESKSDSIDHDDMGERHSEALFDWEASQDESSTMVEHLRLLMKFIQTHLKHTYDSLRGRHARDVAFQDLWYLFAPGDKIYNPSDKQAYQIISVRGGRPALSGTHQGPRGEIQLIPLAHASALEKSKAFMIQCFFLSFDGERFGPVTVIMTIQPYIGKQSIRKLEVFPLEYAKPNARTQDDAAHKSMESQLIKRGEKFATLMNNEKAAHRKYVGFSAGSIREQLDSRVIIDMSLYFRQNANAQQPKIESGPLSPMESDLREVIEIDSHDWQLLDSDITSHIYNDGLIDSHRTDAFIDEFNKSWTLSKNTRRKIKWDHLSLLPAKVWGYVLRNRSWCELDVDEIMPIEQKRENFDDLVLPDSYKELLGGMLKQNSHRVIPGMQDDDFSYGNVKSLVILLHGPPGVGKTRTVECLAEHISQPLLARTCGEIGDNATQVKLNLESDLQLAQRWGCVLLLDDADVLLQTRNRQDMQGNAVLSVALRFLDNYPGILFLTTTRVGSLDEAVKSRIHLSLSYPPLDPASAVAVWKINLSKLMHYANLNVEYQKIMDWVQATKDRGLLQWNGRQIHNACQTAASIALQQDGGKLTVKQFEAIFKASIDNQVEGHHYDIGNFSVGRSEGLSGSKTTNFRDKYSHRSLERDDMEQSGYRSSSEDNVPALSQNRTVESTYLHQQHAEVGPRWEQENTAQAPTEHHLRRDDVRQSLDPMVTLPAALNIGNKEAVKQLIRQDFETIRAGFSFLASLERSGLNPHQIAEFVLECEADDASSNFEPLASFFEDESIDLELRKSTSPHLQLRILPNDLARVIVSIPQDQIWFTEAGESKDKPWTNALKAWMEDYTGTPWLWRPLSARMKDLRPDQVRLNWVCSCGIHAWAEVSIEEAEVMKNILTKRVHTPSRSVFCHESARKASLMDCIRRLATGLVQGSGSTVRSPETAYFQGSRSQAAKQLSSPSQETQGIPIYDQTNPGQQIAPNQYRAQAQDLPTEHQRWILFGISNSDRSVIVEHVEPDRHDRYGDWRFYRKLREHYRAHRGILRCWLSCWQLAHCEFVEFSYPLPLKIVRRRKALPDTSDTEYDYDPRPPRVNIENPPVSEHEFHARLRACGSAYEEQDWGKEHVCRIPKKKSRFTWRRRNESFAFGLQAVYFISWVHVLVYHFVALLLPFVFWVVWQRFHPGDMSTASVPASVFIAFMSCFWTCIGPLGQLGKL